MWFEGGQIMVGPKRPIRTREAEQNLEYLYQDAVFAMQTGEYNAQTQVYRAARKVLEFCGEKYCTQCKEVKSFEDFYTTNSRFSPDGFAAHCKTCNTKVVRGWRKDNPDQLKEYRRQYYHSRKVITDVRNLEDREHTLYRLYSAGGKLLYVGITCNFKNRWEQHKYTQVWWEEVATYELETYDSRSAVFAAEEAAIKTELPVYNKVHKTL